MKVECTAKPKEDGSSGLPCYATPGSAAVDLMASECRRLRAGETTVVPTGLRVAMPEGMAAMVCSRSGLGMRGVVVAQGFGLIDSDYRGEVGVLLYNRSKGVVHVKQGDRIAQLMVIPYIKVEFIPVEVLSETVRGEGGFGSTGT